MTFTSFSHRLFTYACPMGWGAHLEGDMLQGKWDPQEQRLHINLLEIRAVAKALAGFSFPLGSTVLVSLDNSMVVSCINKEGGHMLLFPLEGDRSADLHSGNPHPRKDERHR